MPSGAACSRAGRTPAAGVGGGGRPAARADGQHRGRPPEPRRRPAGAADLQRIDAAIHDGSFDDRPALLRRVRAGGRARPPPAPRSASSARAASTPSTAISSPSPTSRAGEASPRSAFTRCSMAATRRRARPTASCRTSSGGLPLSIRTRASRRSAAATSAMDRDKRWERVEPAYDAIVHGVGERAPSAAAAIARAYARGENDEFVRPTVIDGVDGRVRDGDAVIHCNFRADRARQLTHALADHALQRLRPDRRSAPCPRDLLVVTMTAYEAGLPVEVAFPPEEAHSLSRRAVGARLAPVPRRRDGEVRPRDVLLQRRPRGAVARRGPRARPEPKVATYDLAAGDERGRRRPTRSSTAIESRRLRLHRRELRERRTWSATRAIWDATVRAVETLDACLGADRGRDRRVDAARPDGPRGCCSSITADHGNADEMRDADGNPVTAHSLNPVPIVLAGRVGRGRTLRDGVLADVAPTILELAGLPPWPGDHRPLAPRRLRAPGQPAGGSRGRCATIRAARHSPEVRSVNPFLAVGQIIVSIAADGRHPAAGSRHRPVRHVRWRLGGVSQPARHRAAALAVHDRAARPVRPVLAGELPLRPDDHGGLRG